MPCQPLRAGWFRCILERAPHRIFATDLTHPQQLRIHPIEPQRRHVRVPAMARQHRQKDRAEHVRFARRMVTLPTQWAVLHKRIPQSRRLQEFDEEHHLAKRRYRRYFVPPNMNSPAESIHHAAPLARSLDGQFTLTLWVNDTNCFFCSHSQH
jgi:hypothetical protein